LALALVEDRVDVAECIDDRGADLRRRAVEATEHATERGVVERRTPQRGGEITAALAQAHLRAADALLQAIDLADDHALLRGARVEARQRGVDDPRPRAPAAVAAVTLPATVPAVMTAAAVTAAAARLLPSNETEDAETECYADHVRFLLSASHCGKRVF